MTKSFYDLVPSAPKGRYDGIDRPYSVEEVEKLRGSFPIEYTLNPSDPFVFISIPAWKWFGLNSAKVPERIIGISSG